MAEMSFAEHNNAAPGVMRYCQASGARGVTLWASPIGSDRRSRRAREKIKKACSF
jgi:hypothetical protein